MLINVIKSNAPKLARCLQNNDNIEILGCTVGNLTVTYEVDAPDFFIFPDWVEVLA